MKRSKGFTLIELIASIVLIGFLSLLGTGVLMTSISGYEMSFDNSEAALELKPQLDLLSTYMSDIVKITCFTQDAQMTFKDTNNEEYTVKIDSSTKEVSITGGQVIHQLSDATLRVNYDSGYVEDIVLTVTKANIDKAYVLEFSPRTKIETVATTCP